MEHSVQFSLNHTNFLHLLQQEKFSDVTLVCDGRLLKCHKFMLAASSTYFGELFELLSEVDNPVVVLKDISKENLMKVLEFIYCGKINVHRQDMPGFMKLVEYFKLKMEARSKTPPALNETVLEMMSQETIVGNLTLDSFQISNDFETFDDFDDSSDDSESTLTSRTSSIKLSKPKLNEPSPKKLKTELLHAENKVKCNFCQKYVPEKHSTDHHKHCFKNRNRQPLKCPECRQDFEVSPRLRNHVLKAHPLKPTSFTNHVSYF